ncbi:MAG TPA: Ig-like domain-containing protein [Gemmatimonadales bacterium]|nr:Ig-like domain-containing protein [Gemmatimonadales bacterium]
MLLALTLILQQVPAPTPVASVTIRPADAAISVGDTLRLTAQAFDSAGRELSDVRIRWFQAGGQFEGTVDSTGLATGGAVGALRVTALASARGGGRPKTAFAVVTIVPGPAAAIGLAPAPARLYVGQAVAVAATVTSAAGDLRHDPVTWTSDQPGVLQSSATGVLTAVRPGRATVTARSGQAATTLQVAVAANPVSTVEVSPGTATVRTGDVVRFAFDARDRAGKPVPDVVPEWMVASGTARIEADGGFVASDPGTYRVVGAFAGRAATATVTVLPRDVVRPTTLVGRVPVKGFASAEFWLHPDGRHGYLSTIGDRLYAIDLANPAAPVITDSVMVDARVINDVMTTEDGRYGVITREGASTRKNGIVILSFEDPAHPKAIAEFTETVTGGVHSTFIYRGYVYLTDDATGSMRVIDIRDPLAPRQVARWETPGTGAGRMLHDIDVQDGLAYLSYWNDGLVILDVGNGMRGGSPENPQFVSQFKYDLEGLYRDVAAVGGPGFIRGTHTAWRSGRYVFVGDEVFAAQPQPTAGPSLLGLGRAYGRLHVVDVSDIGRPTEVAWYEPRDGGTHNVWVAGDTLYLGDYQGGLRVLDVSGELRGDLLAQDREIAHVYTGDSKGQFPNAAMAWGAIYRDGNIYVPDVFSGLWIVRVEPKNELTP